MCFSFMLLVISTITAFNSSSAALLQRMRHKLLPLRKASHSIHGLNNVSNSSLFTDASTQRTYWEKMWSHDVAHVVHDAYDYHRTYVRVIHVELPVLPSGQSLNCFATARSAAYYYIYRSESVIIILSLCLKEKVKIRCKTM